MTDLYDYYDPHDWFPEYNSAISCLMEVDHCLKCNRVDSAGFLVKDFLTLVRNKHEQRIEEMSKEETKGKEWRGLRQLVHKKLNAGLRLAEDAAPKAKTKVKAAAAPKTAVAKKPEAGASNAPVLAKAKRQKPAAKAKAETMKVKKPAAKTFGPRKG